MRVVSAATMVILPPDRVTSEMRLRGNARQRVDATHNPERVLQW